MARVPRAARAVAWLLAAAFALRSLPSAADPAEADLQAALDRLAAPDALVADAAVEEVAAFGASAAEPLLRRLDSPRRDERAGAIRALGLLAVPSTRRPVTEALAGSLARNAPDDLTSRYHRILLLEALGRIGADDGGRALLEGVRVTSEDPFERAHAAIALFRSGDESGYDAVRKLLRDEDPALRVLAVGAIGESEDPRVPGWLVPLTKDASWLVRDAAFAALGPWRDRDIVAEALRRGAEDPSWFVRETVARAAASEIYPEKDGEQ